MHISYERDETNKKEATRSVYHEVSDLMRPFICSDGNAQVVAIRTEGDNILYLHVLSGTIGTGYFDEVPGMDDMLDAGVGNVQFVRYLEPTERIVLRGWHDDYPGSEMD